jgi:hypothetical protein
MHALSNPLPARFNLGPWQVNDVSLDADTAIARLQQSLAHRSQR